MRVIMVDNRDSFTYNLVYDLEQSGHEVTVFRNDASLDALLAEARAGTVFVLSPGPGGPAGAGVCVPLVRAAAGRFGVLGVCLGHQAIVHAFGGVVARTDEPVHGRAGEIFCTPHPLFDTLPQVFIAGRYHSLAAIEVPGSLKVIATTARGTVMAIVHRDLRIAGFQFHPESILTGRGRGLLDKAVTWLAGTREVEHAAGH